MKDSKDKDKRYLYLRIKITQYFICIFYLFYFSSYLLPKIRIKIILWIKINNKRGPSYGRKTR